MSPPTSTSRPVRVTVDLSAEVHADLRRRCLDYAGALGVPRVSHTDVLRALLDELRTDTALADRIAAVLARPSGGRSHAA